MNSIDVNHEHTVVTADVPVFEYWDGHPIYDFPLPRVADVIDNVSLEVPALFNHEFIFNGVTKFSPAEIDSIPLIALQTPVKIRVHILCGMPRAFMIKFRGKTFSDEADRQRFANPEEPFLSGSLSVFKGLAKRRVVYSSVVEEYLAGLTTATYKNYEQAVRGVGEVNAYADKRFFEVNQSGLEHFDLPLDGAADFVEDVTVKLPGEEDAKIEYVIGGVAFPIEKFPQLPLMFLKAVFLRVNFLSEAKRKLFWIESKNKVVKKKGKLLELFPEFVINKTIKIKDGVAECPDAIQQAVDGLRC